MKTHVNPAEARLGVMELEKFLVWLADFNPELAGKIDGDESLTWNLYALFMGITPVNRLKDGKHELKTEISIALKDFGITNVFSIAIPECVSLKITYKRLEFVNARALARVVEFNQQVFPGVTDPVDWLICNPNILCYESLPEADFGHIRYGILSGFPPDACLNFVKYKLGMAELGKKGITLPILLRNPEELANFLSSGNVLKVLEQIPEYEEIVRSVRPYGFGFYQCFVFSTEDEMYIKSLESSFLASLG